MNPKNAIRTIIAAGLLLAACGGPSDTPPRTGRDTSLSLTGRMVLWGGADPERLTRDQIVCVGEIDFNAMHWFCGRGGYTSEGAASYHGTIRATPAGFDLLDVDGSVNGCAPVALPVPSAPVLPVTAAYGCGDGYWTLTLPWVAVP